MKKMTQTTNVMSYLNIPTNRMARSTSQESFATDVSVLSLSSFITSDNAGSHSKLDRAQTLDDCETDSGGNPEMVKLREDMFERMLECDDNSLQSLPAKLPSHSRNCSVSNAKPNNDDVLSSKTKKDLSITTSEKDLLDLCGQHKSRGSMYKSFSTTDLTFSLETFDLSLVKHCTSQAWIPSDYAQVVQCRKRHLKDLKEQNSVDFTQFTYDDDVNTCDEKACRNRIYDRQNRRVGTGESSHFSEQPHRQYFSRKAASDENINTRQSGKQRIGGIFMKKLKFSKEIGRRIKEDLMKKLGKHKHHLITSVDLEQEKGRPLSALERNFIIFHWLQSLDEHDQQEKQ